MIKIFIYDDSEARRDSLEALIELTDNFQFVGSAGDCTNVENDMKVATPDIVLMDIEMPNVDGIDGVKMIKSSFPHIKIIMQTVYDDTENIFKKHFNMERRLYIEKASIN
ncbi:MAG: response regulator [Saprospiraceae bacterium]